jgi:flagellar biosynthesis chaperone FliJ
MAFQFTLHSVLRARIVVEEREERLLQKILVEIAQCSREITRLDEEMVSVNKDRVGNVNQQTLGRTLHGQYGEMQELGRVRNLLIGQVEKLEELKAMQLSVYNTARQNRELLTDMRATKREAYDTDLSRREQSVLDDNFIARRSLS